MFLAERLEEFWRVAGGDGEEQTARRLRVVEQVPDFFRHAIRELDAARNEFDVSLEPAGDVALARIFGGFGQELDALGVNNQAHFAADGHFASVAQQAEAGDVRGGVDVEFGRHFAGPAVERAHGLGGGSRSSLAGAVLFERGRDDAGADAFGQHQPVARPGCGV